MTPPMVDLFPEPRYCDACGEELRLVGPEFCGACHDAELEHVRRHSLHRIEDGEER